MKTILMKVRVSSFILVILVLIMFAGLAKGWRTFSFSPGVGLDTHEYMSRRAIELVIPESNYPDVHKFKEAIIEGSSKTKNDFPVEADIWGIFTMAGSGLYIIHNPNPFHQIISTTPTLPGRSLKRVTERDLMYYV